MAMDPILAKQLYDAGKISAPVYQAIVDGAGVSVDPADAGAPDAGSPAAPAAPAPVASYAPAPMASYAPPVASYAPPAPKPSVPNPVPLNDAPSSVPRNITADGTMSFVPAAQRQAANYANENPGAQAPAQNKYETRLTPDEEADFKQWKSVYAPNDSGADYDLRGAFKAGVTPDPENGHMPDTYKKPNHPTFSNESQYATGADAAKAGHWEGDKFVPPAKKMNADDTMLAGQKASTEAQVGILRGQAESVSREHEAFAQGQSEMAAAINEQANNEQQRLKQDEEYKARARDKQMALSEASVKRAKEISEMKTDSGRYWRNLPDGNKLLLFIGSALGGGQTAYNMIQNNINRDVADQQAAIQNAKDGWKMEQNEAARQAAIDDDWLAFRSAKAVEGWTLLKNRTEGLLANAKSQTAIEQGKQAVAAIDLTIQKTQLEYQQHEYKVAKGREQAAASASAAQAAKVEATRKEAMAFKQKLILGDENNKPVSEDVATALTNRMFYGVGTAPAALAPRDKGGKSTADENAPLIQELDNGMVIAKEYQKYFDSAPKGDVTSKIPGVNAIPGTDAQAHKLKIDEYNNALTLGLGPIVHAMNKGKPGAVELHTLLGQLQLKASDTEPEKRSKVERFITLHDNARRTLGAPAATPTAGQAPPPLDTSGFSGVRK